MIGTSVYIKIIRSSIRSHLVLRILLIINHAPSFIHTLTNSSNIYEISAAVRDTYQSRPQLLFTIIGCQSQIKLISMYLTGSENVRQV